MSHPDGRAARLAPFALATLLSACVSPKPSPVTLPPTPGPVVPPAATPVATPMPETVSAPAPAPAAPTPTPTGPAPSDLYSHAIPADVRVRRMRLDLSIDFDRKVVSGTATHEIERAVKAAPLVLDVKGLKIGSVSVGDDRALAPATWRVEPGSGLLGDALIVELPPGADRVAVSYETTPDGTGLQWLSPAQTAGRTKPFLFSQSQSIHARTWIPCQDTPGNRVTFEATIRAPEGYRVVMAADEVTPKDAPPGTTAWRIDEPIPTYLAALAAGDLAFRPIGPRNGVWAEPVTVDAAAREFTDVPRMMEIVEKTYGPYRWKRFDMLVLPPSFPAGGMENPKLTFLSPTILAGDRSLVNTVGHELAHSWSGNLVTNATWRDFWLNEGFTTYLEQRIVEAVYGRERFLMEAALDLEELRAELATLPAERQVLHVDLKGEDPDDAFSTVPYMKGASFLRNLEQRFGREAFDGFLRGWFDGHAFRSVTTEEFRAWLEKNLVAKRPEAAAGLDLDRWIEGGGLPDDLPTYPSARLAAVDAAAKTFLAGGPAANVDGGRWSTQEWVRFVRAIGPKLEPFRLAELDRIFGLSTRRNGEIASVWLALAARSAYRVADDRIEAFLVGVGRPKLIKPVYRALLEGPGGARKARAIFDKAKPGYHPIAADAIEGILSARPGSR